MMKRKIQTSLGTDAIAPMMMAAMMSSGLDPDFFAMRAMSRAFSDVPTTSPAKPSSYGISVGAGEQPAWTFGPRIVMLLLTERCLLTSRTGTEEAGVVLGSSKTLPGSALLARPPGGRVKRGAPSTTRAGDDDIDPNDLTYKEAFKKWMFDGLMN